MHRHRPSGCSGEDRAESGFGDEGEQGIAVFPALPAGMAQIRAQYPGFSPYAEKAALRKGENIRTLTLTIAPFRETVTVRATPDDTAGS